MKPHEPFLSDSVHQRVRTHAFIPGGGVAVLSATVQIDFLQFIIGRGHFTEYFDWISGVSAGSMVAAALAMPQLGRPLPLHNDCRPIRRTLREDSKLVFDPARYRFFLARRAAYDLAMLLSDFFDNKKPSFDQSLDRLPLTREDKRFWKNLLGQSSDLKNRAMAQLAKWLEAKSHFDDGPLKASLQRAFNLRGLDPETMVRPARMADLLAHVLIPVQMAEPNDNTRCYHVGPLGQIDLSNLFGTSAKRFEPHGTVAQAVLESSSLSPLLQPQRGQDGRYRTDGGANIGPRDVFEIANLLDPSFGPYGIANFNCSPLGLTAQISHRDLSRSTLTGNSYSNMRQQFDGNHGDQWLKSVHDPHCHFYVDVRHGSPYRPFNLRAGRIFCALQEFCADIVGHDFAQAIACPPMELPTLALASSDPEIHDYFVKIGIKTIAHRVPEMVALAKRVVPTLVAKKGWGQHAVDTILSDIDRRFPPEALLAFQAMRNQRYLPGISEDTMPPFFRDDHARSGSKTSAANDLGGFGPIRVQRRTEPIDPRAGLGQRFG